MESMAVHWIDTIFGDMRYYNEWFIDNFDTALEKVKARFDTLRTLHFGPYDSVISSPFARAMEPVNVHLQLTRQPCVYCRIYERQHNSTLCMRCDADVENKYKLLFMDRAGLNQDAVARRRGNVSWNWNRVQTAVVARKKAMEYEQTKAFFFNRMNEDVLGRVLEYLFVIDSPPEYNLEMFTAEIEREYRKLSRSGRRMTLHLCMNHDPRINCMQSIEERRGKPVKPPAKPIWMTRVIHKRKRNQI